MTRAALLAAALLLAGCEHSRGADLPVSCDAEPIRCVETQSPAQIREDLRALYDAVASAKESGVAIGAGGVDLLPAMQTVVEALVNMDARLRRLEAANTRRRP